jgi:hypothetical protein
MTRVHPAVRSTHEPLLALHEPCDMIGYGILPEGRAS